MNQAAATTSVASSKNPSTFGQTVTFTATVASGTGTPTGTVTFKDGATTLDSSALSDGVATLSTASLTAGTHTITAEYLGDTNFAASTGTLAGGQEVNSTNTLVLLNASPNPSVLGQTVTFTATILIQGINHPSAPSVCTVTGTVAFKDGAATLGSIPVNANCQAVYSTALLAPGDHLITAEYSGDGNYSGGASDVLTETVYAFLYLPMIIK